jgi:glycosyltransferase involved in cell wall biosynthesis
MTFNIAGAWAGRGNRTGRVARNVYYLGWLGGAELAKAMRASLTVVVPSTYYEGLPMVVLEAMGLGVPVVASGHGGLPEVVRDGFNGRLFRPGDAKDLGRTLRELRSAPESTRRLGETAIRDAQSEFSQARFFQRIVSVYERAIWGR